MTLTDEELAALAALSQNEAVLMAGDNALRALNNDSPAWREGCGFLPATTKLYDYFQQQGILP